MAACFLAGFMALPLVVVAASPGGDDEAFVCRAEVESRLAETLEGKLEFLLVNALAGRPPAERFVVTIDHGYTGGVDENLGEASADASETAVGHVLWLQGSLMDRDTYFGEQYLFFGYPQLYVSQVKSGLLWPSQVERLKSLYFSPVAAPASIYLVGAFPFMEEYSGGTWALIIARLVLVLAAVAAAVAYRKRRRRWTPGLIWVVGAYVLIAIGLAVPSL